MNSPRDAQNALREQTAKPSGNDAGSTNCAPATFRFVCESSDGKLCLFEDAEGHYTVVRAARLA